MPYKPIIHPDELGPGDIALLKGNHYARVLDNGPGDTRTMWVNHRETDVLVDEIMFKLREIPPIGGCNVVLGAVSSTKTGEGFV